ncbi:MAG: hypothetical protein WEB88_13515, partial [Gemmatimonadota bacterium]
TAEVPGTVQVPGGAASPWDAEDRDAAEEDPGAADDLDLSWSGLDDDATGELPGDLAFYQAESGAGAESVAEGESDKPAVAPDEDTDGESRRSPAGEMMTETMADLYLRQNFPDRAAEIFRALLRERPGDARLEARLAVAEAVLAGPGGAASGDSAGTVDAPPGLEDVFFSAGDEREEDKETDAQGGLEDAFFGRGEDAGDEAAEAGRAEAAESAAESPGPTSRPDEPPAPGARSTPAAGARPWLEGVESAWTGGAGAGHDEPSPYAPDVEDAEEPTAAPSGPSAASYLDQVLAWRPREDLPATGEGAPAADAGSVEAAAGSEVVGAGADADALAAAPDARGIDAEADVDAADVAGGDAAADADDEELLLDEIVDEAAAPGGRGPDAPVADGPRADAPPSGAGEPFPFELPPADEAPEAADSATPPTAETPPESLTPTADAVPADELFPFESPLDDAQPAAGGEAPAARPEAPPPAAAPAPPAAERRPGTATRDEGDVAEAFAAWYDGGDDGGIDGAAQAALGGAGDAGTSLTDDAEEDAGSDEDLDMFRSWLQSLKK